MFGNCLGKQVQLKTVLADRFNPGEQIIVTHRSPAKRGQERTHEIRFWEEDGVCVSLWKNERAQLRLAPEGC